MHKFTEEGQLKKFINNSENMSIRNLINNPMEQEEVKTKISKIFKEQFKNGRIPSMLGMKHTTETLQKQHDVKWKEYSNHKTFYKAQARKIMEQKLERKLNSTEIIHHLDHNRKNNEPDNLHLFSSHTPHILYHRMLRRAVAEEAGLSRTNWWFY